MLIKWCRLDAAAPTAAASAMLGEHVRYRTDPVPWFQDKPTSAGLSQRFVTLQ
jgi:hypothetical protein